MRRIPLPLPLPVRPLALAALALALAGCEGDPTGSDGETTPVALALGDSHSCALMAAGNVFCWGANTVGQLGTGTLGGQSPTPVAAAGELRFAALYAGGNTTCGLTEAGRLYCWGGNTRGRLGVGVPAGQTASATPVETAPGTVFAQATVGALHTCALDAAGQASCWGHNGGGQLGIGTVDAENHAVPTAVSGGLAFRAVSAGTLHTCAITQAGAAYCWGTNYNQNLFPGGDGRYLVPTRVGGDLAYASIHTGSVFTCGLTPAREAWCWGENGGGALGIGSYQGGPAPRLAFGGATLLELAVNGENNVLAHACTITSGGQATCFGPNSTGQLGGTSPTQPCGSFTGVQCSTTGVAVAGGHRFAQVDLGTTHSCGITQEDEVWCWGDGAEGQLGDGAAAGSVTPVQARIAFAGD